MYLVRKISRAKWDSTDDLAGGEIPADAVTADLRTTDNSLSLWVCDDPCAPDQCPVDLDDAILALVAGADRVDKIDVVWMARDQLDQAGVSLDMTDGHTPVIDLTTRHLDAVRLDYVRLGVFARHVLDALETRQHKRLTKKGVVKLIAAAVDGSRLGLANLKEKVRVEVQKHLQQATPG